MRIRTIKPEFWTDSRMVSLPRDARLLFVGLWNAADDHGWLPDDAEQLRMLLFPGDPDFQFAPLLELLIAAERVERHVFDDQTSALRVSNWERHQRVDHPAKSRISREASRKVAIPQAARRALAIKYQCKPGGTVDATCYYCGAGGRIHWFNLANGKPSGWVVFPDMEIDHFFAESSGGESLVDNLVLSCRECNRAKGTKDGSMFLAKLRETSRGLAPEQGTGNREQGTGNREYTAASPTPPADAAGEQKPKARFAPPTRAELDLEAAKLALPDTQVTLFVSYYSSNGWKVGRNPMKSWQHALAGWAARWREKEGQLAIGAHHAHHAPRNPLDTSSDPNATF